MLTWFLIYCFVMIESITALFSWYPYMIMFGCIILVGMVIISGISTECETGEKGTWSYWWDNNPTIGKFKNLGKWFLGVGIVFMILTHLIPSQKNLAIIIGSGITYEVITSETGKRIGGKAIDLLEQKIDDALKDKDGKESSDNPPKDIPKKDGRLT